jgi:cytochrome b561
MAKRMHWLTALLFLASYVSVYYRYWFTEDKTPENWHVLQLHLSVGMIIGVLVVLRIIWKIMNRSPDPEPGTRLEHLAAEMGHYALYAVMVAMPLTGYLGTGANSEYFFLFDIPKFELTSLSEPFVLNVMGMTFLITSETQRYSTLASIASRPIAKAYLVCDCRTVCGMEAAVELQGCIHCVSCNRKPDISVGYRQIQSPA